MVIGCVVGLFGWGSLNLDDSPHLVHLYVVWYV